MKASCSSWQVALWFILAGCSSSNNPTTPATWSGIKQAGVQSQFSYALAMAADSAGNIYFAGDTSGGLDGNLQTGTFDYVLGKYANNGTLTWLKQLGATSQTVEATSIALDTSGNIYIAGFTTGGLNGNTQTGTQDYFVAKYNSSGGVTWVSQLGAASTSSQANGVGVDTSGNVYVAGFTTGGLNGNALTGTQDFFIAKYNSGGTLTWLTEVGASASSSNAIGLAVDTSGNPYVTGWTTGGLNGGSQTGAYDYFIWEYNSSGQPTWGTQYGVASQHSQANGVAVDSSGNIYVAGWTTGGLAGNTQAGTDDYFVAKYTKGIGIVWLKQLGAASGISYATCVAVDSLGNVYVGGDTTVGLNGNTQMGATDYLVSKYDNGGNLTWLKQLGTSLQTSVVRGVAVDTAGNVYGAGYTTGGLDGNVQVGSKNYFIAKYNSSGTLQ